MLIPLVCHTACQRCQMHFRGRINLLHLNPHTSVLVQYSMRYLIILHLTFPALSILVSLHGENAVDNSYISTFGWSARRDVLLLPRYTNVQPISLTRETFVAHPRSKCLCICLTLRQCWFAPYRHLYVRHIPQFCKLLITFSPM